MEFCLNTWIFKTLLVVGLYLTLMYLLKKQLLSILLSLSESLKFLIYGQSKIFAVQ